ncbi:hypothetical protein CJD36_012530 [Flavipsychrobacter stenotrophus]|uniref:Uncharacterized protein n=1 Tax=Flavipsychrobacter stenotrophus TaxID=2077091 RepID=A0A2S7SV44_9BACT|nr:hypothetical protein [Flavipsychrobacter stenotrophus]PQJ10789.1 hypothetical protein CJD36_012530 [Flavipsychrobacter stenotrophus]
MITKEVLINAVQAVLLTVPSKPFLCLPMSATLYAKLKNEHNVDAKLVTGNLSYKEQIIFQQDFSISEVRDNILQLWAGHAWVEVDGLICDLSLPRTLYANEFTKSCKKELVQRLGEGRGCVVASQSVMHVAFGLSYSPIDYLQDSIATAIIKGSEQLFY